MGDGLYGNREDYYDARHVHIECHQIMSSEKFAKKFGGNGPPK